MRTKFNPTVVEQLKRHLDQEEQFLCKLQESLQSLQIKGSLSSSTESQTVSHSVDFLKHISDLSRLLDKQRSDLIGTLEETFALPPEGIRLKSLLETASAFPEQKQIMKAIQQVRTKAHRTLGTLQATVRSILQERQIIELTLCALGVGEIPERYTENGERLTCPSVSSYEMRS